MSFNDTLWGSNPPPVAQTTQQEEKATVDGDKNSQAGSSVNWANPENVAAFVGSPSSVDDIPPIKMYGCDFRKEILHMHQGISLRGYWQLLLAEPPKGQGYMFTSTDWQSNLLYNKDGLDSRVHDDGHSGCTEAICLRYCQYIARNGWKEFSKNING